jgi:hypothetical protein
MPVINGVPNRIPMRLIEARFEAAASKGYLAQSERFAVVSLVEHALKTFLNQLLEGNMLLCRCLFTTRHQRVRYIYGCFHIAIYIKLKSDNQGRKQFRLQSGNGLFLRR